MMRVEETDELVNEISICMWPPFLTSTYYKQDYNSLLSNNIIVSRLISTQISSGICAKL